MSFTSTLVLHALRCSDLPSPSGCGTEGECSAGPVGDLIFLGPGLDYTPQPVAVRWDHVTRVLAVECGQRACTSPPGLAMKASHRPFMLTLFMHLPAKYRGSTGELWSPRGRQNIRGSQSPQTSLHATTSTLDWAMTKYAVFTKIQVCLLQQMVLLFLTTKALAYLPTFDQTKVN